MEQPVMPTTGAVEQREVFVEPQRVAREVVNPRARGEEEDTDQQQNGARVFPPVLGLRERVGVRVIGLL
jgi:hypothetical protein